MGWGERSDNLQGIDSCEESRRKSLVNASDTCRRGRVLVGGWKIGQDADGKNE